MGVFRILFLALAFCASNPARAQDIWVPDGDTLHLDRKPIRLEGIDAPEMGQTCRTEDGHAFDCGALARRALLKILKAGPITCSAAGTDLYARTLGHCRAGGVDVNQAMVARGFARAYVRYS
ncbi:thermonuclease family protein, partial [Aestuariivirga litoralis]|uniref:thermonuclease family protein n=1 Tax=Aestuariivirga litoralis TaxID=2650924 RepID=UPI0018C7E83B